MKTWPRSLATPIRSFPPPAPTWRRAAGSSSTSSSSPATRTSITPRSGRVLIARFLEGRGFKVGHHRPAGLALGRALQGAGHAAALLRRRGRQPRLDAEPAHRAEEEPLARTSTRRAAAPSCRPDRATIVYANLCREAFPDVPIVLGGIEASLRRIAHYDYWSDKVRRSILLDAKADLLVFGMGERPVWEIARPAAPRASASSDIRDVRGTAYLINDAEMKAHEADPAERVGRPEDGGAALVRGGRRGQAGVRADVARLPVETNPRQRAAAAAARTATGPSTSTRRRCRWRTARAAADAVAMDELYDLPFNARAAPHVHGARSPRSRR